jgi:glycosyltransferase involved in cell wall biosynthesis
VLRHDVCRGLARALNTGIAMATQPWVARMDADDVSPPHRFARQMAMLQDDPSIDLLAGAQAEFSEVPTRIERVKTVPTSHDEIVRALRWRNLVSHPSVVMRRSLLDQLGAYAEVGLLEDYDLFTRIVAAGGRLKATDETMILVRVTAAQRRRRGGLAYLLTELRFRTLMLRTGRISMLNYLVSVPVYAAFRLAPWQLKNALYRFVRRAPAALTATVSAVPIAE